MDHPHLTALLTPPTRQNADACQHGKAEERRFRDIGHQTVCRREGVQSGPIGGGNHIGIAAGRFAEVAGQ